MNMSLHTSFHVLRLGLCCALIGLCVACADEIASETPVAPATQGTFTDTRDGVTYHYVTYGSLDWMVENGRYQLADPVLCSIYQDADTYFDATNGKPSSRNLIPYGCLYTLEGAKQAAPAGWRVPTDADWQQLEQACGMSAEDAAARDWRGNVALGMMSYAGHETPINILMGGYYTNHTIMATSGWRFKGSQAFFWTNTQDTEKAGTYYFYRKFFYDNPAIYRESMETENNKLSVRYVREHI